MCIGQVNLKRACTSILITISLFVLITTQSIVMPFSASLSASAETWSSWQSLEGTVRSNSNPVTFFNTFSGQRLITFVIDTDNLVNYRMQADIRNPEDWLPWHKIGAPMGGVRANSDPAVEMNRDGRLFVFVVANDNKLWFTSQLSPGSDIWNGWQLLGGTVRTNTSPVVVTNDAGATEVYVVGTDNVVSRIKQLTTSGFDWSNWQSLGGVPVRDTPAVVRNEDGQIQVFVVALCCLTATNSVFTIKQQEPGGNSWTTYQLLGGKVKANTSPVAVAFGPLDVVFVLGTDNKLWYNQQTSPGSTTWAGWQPIGPGILRDTTPAVITETSGHVRVFVVTAIGNSLLTSSRIGLFNSISEPYQSLGGGVRINTSPDSACVEEGDLPFPLANSCLLPADISPPRIQVFVVGNDGALWHRWRTGL